MKIKKEKLHIYVRCSTDNQIENSIERQVEDGIKFSKQHNMDYQIWNDEGKSGIKSFEENREQLQLLLWEIDLGGVKHLWVESYDRLTRNLDDSIKIDKRVIDNEVTIYEGLLGNQKYEPNELNQRLIKVVTSMIGTEQKKGEIQKSINQKIRKFKEGYYVRGNVSYGFNKKDGYLVENKEESKWVKKIFKWFSEGESLESISLKCKSYGLKSKRGNPMSNRQIHIILSNKEYIGKTIYTDKTKDPHRINKTKYPYEDESKWEVHINDNLPRIISDKLFDEVQKKLSFLKLKPTKNEYFLHGKLECGCGSQWVGRMKSRVDRGKPNEFYYQCSNTDKWYHRNRSGREHLHQKGICNKPKRINTSDLDNLVWNEFLNTFKNSSYIKERVKIEVLGGKYETSSNRKKVNRELKQINNEINQLKVQRTELLKQKFTLNIDEKTFKEIDLSIGIELGKLMEKYDKEKQKEDFIERRSEWLDWVSEHKKQHTNYSIVTDMKKRRRILDTYVSKIKVKYYEETQQHDIKINFRFPLVDDGIEYMKDSNSKMKWDKWGNPYRVKMGRTQISLSQLNSSNIGVGNIHSTVTDLAKFLGWSTFLPSITAM